MVVRYRAYLSFLLIGLFLIITSSSCNMSKKINVSCEKETGVCSSIADTHLGIDLEATSPKESSMKLVYYYDPLCGWCYGFSSVMSQVNEKYGDQLEIEVVCGGLFLGNRSGPVNRVAPHIKSGAYKSVELRTGVVFGKSFLNDIFGEGKMILNSLPPTIALSIVKEKYPNQQLKFAELLLKAVYSDGIDPTDVDALSTYAVQVGLDKEEFKVMMADVRYKKAAKKEFDTFNNSQYAGMPSVVLVKEGKENLISHGYVGFKKLESKLDSLIKP